MRESTAHLTRVVRESVDGADPRFLVILTDVGTVYLFAVVRIARAPIPFFVDGKSDPAGSVLGFRTTTVNVVSPRRPSH